MSDMNTSTGAPKRPQFLTVLCILSYIGCGLGIIFGLMGYMTNKAAADSNLGAEMSQAMSGAMDEAMESGAMTDSERQMASSLGEAFGGGVNYANAATASLVQVLMCVVCAAGVFMMWKLKKTGFYIYTLGQAVSVAAPFIWSSGLGVFGDMFAIVGSIFPVIFVILYALNLKHMS